MNENKRGRKRTYDAQKTRETILAAACSVLAEHGFKGTSVDAISEKAGYNKSLIFQYFKDKQNLYLEVLKKADHEINKLLTQLFQSYPNSLTDICDKQSFMHFLRTLVESLIDFMMQKPDFMRLINWEQAEGWRSLAKVSSEIQPTYLEQVEKIFKKAQEANLIRSNIDIKITFLLVQQICWTSPMLLSFFKSVPIKNNLLPDSLKNLRNQVVDFIVSGITGVR
jgi:AcrR family transcriptional regulator